MDLETIARNCTVQNGNPCPACDEHIRYAPLIRRQQENSRNIRTKMNAKHDPFILKLPLEISSNIFLLSMGDRDTGDVCQRGKGLPTPLLLGAVCSGWRELARRTPALWSRLVFTFSYSTLLKNRINTPHLIADWLGRSGGLPLALQISYDGLGYGGSIYTSDHTNRWNSVIETLNLHSGRWCEVDLALPRHYIAALRGTFTPNCLRKLSFSHREYNYPEDIVLEFKMTKNPSPMTFEFSGFHLKNVNVSWDKLVDLELNGTSLDGVLQIIREAPLLETCLLLCIFPSAGDFPTTPSPGTIIRHPKIQKLVVSSRHTGVVVELVNSLKLRSLESCNLSLYTDDINPLPIDAVISFIKHSTWRLKTLNLWYNVPEHWGDEPYPGLEDIKRLLQVVPHLQHRLGARGVSCYQ